MKKQANDFLNSIINDNTTKKDLDIIKYIKKVLKEYEPAENRVVDNWEFYFNEIWSNYPRRIDKQRAIKVFKNKIVGLSVEETRDKCNKIYKQLMLYKNQVENLGTEEKYIKHLASWLNAEVPNSK